MLVFCVLTACSCEHFWVGPAVSVGTGGLSFVVAALAICHGRPWTGPAWMFQLSSAPSKVGRLPASMCYDRV